jgi:anti-anti-sigma factor
MEFVKEQVDDVLIVRLQGRLDSSTAQSVRERLMRLVTDLYPHVAIDLSKVNYISSAGLQVLLSLARKVQQSKGKVVLFGVVPDVNEIFLISGFDKIFTIRLDNDSAVAALKEI